MGEARTKSKSRAAILANEPECIYCGKQSETVEHMPPTSMFKNRFRLSGYEFASCKICNHSTRASDAAASFFARISPSNAAPEWEKQEANKLVGTIARLAPKAVSEIFDPQKSRKVWTKGRDPIFSRMHQLELDGVATHHLMQAFGAKLGMALFRQHCGKRMEEGGTVFSKVYFNSGLTRGEARANLSILPLFAELKQGKQVSGPQFNYRFNCDEKSIFGAFISFHNNLYFRVFAFQEPEKFRNAFDMHDDRETRFGTLSFLSENWIKN